MCKINGLYGITIDDDPDIEEKVASALAGGASIIQFRDKISSKNKKRKVAEKLKRLCHGRALFIINDDLDLAIDVVADGVHLGKHDGNIAAARKRIGGKLIGVSCYNQLSLAKQAQADGADYVAFGRFFSSRTKPDAIQASPDLIIQAKQILSIPIIAIGGITEKNAGSLIAAGADAIAVINGLFNQPDITKTAQNYCDLFKLKEFQ